MKHVRGPSGCLFEQIPKIEIPTGMNEAKSEMSLLNIYASSLHYACKAWQCLENAVVSRHGLKSNGLCHRQPSLQAKLL